MKNLYLSLFLTGIASVFSIPASADAMDGCSVATPCVQTCPPVVICPTPAPAPICSAPIYSAPIYSAPTYSPTYAAPTYSAPVTSSYSAQMQPTAPVQPTPMIQTPIAPSAPVASSPAPSSIPSQSTNGATMVSWDTAWNATRAYLNANNKSICALKTEDPAGRYPGLVEQLKKSGENFKSEGVDLCFPSREVWTARPQVASETLAFLRRVGINI